MKIPFTMTMKKETKVTLFPKVLILLTLGFGIKLFFSCTTYSQDPIEIDYNYISVIGIDNSDRFLLNHSDIDTIYSDAVALKLTLSDTSKYYTTLSLPNLLQVFSFQNLKADDIVISYVPRNKVTDIKIKTLLDINDDLKAGDDISEFILCESRDSFNLYHNLNHGISWLNEIQSHNKEGSIILVLKASVKNTNAHFEITVTLDNGIELLGTTEIFTIIES